MLKNFGDHSANERTFLAWVRTSISIMAFGVIIEKFDLFLMVASASIPTQMRSLPDQKYGTVTGLTLVLLGISMILIAAIRYQTTGRRIDSPDQYPAMGMGIHLIMAAVIIFMGCGLLTYMVMTLIP